MFGASGDGAIPNKFAAAIVAFICIYVAGGFAWSWGSLRILVPSEIFPLEIRPAGQGISLAVNMLCTFAVALAQAFLPMLCHVKFGLFYYFGGWVLANCHVAVRGHLPAGVPIDCMEDALVLAKKGSPLVTLKTGLGHRDELVERLMSFM
jgi:hypothetical protein